MTISALLERWEARASEFRTNGYTQGAAVLATCIRELGALANDEPLLSLADAAQRCGYSADHLSRLMRAGELPNHGRKHAPRVKLSECPRKTLTLRTSDAYDLATDARSLAARRSRRRAHGDQTTAA